VQLLTIHDDTFDVDHGALVRRSLADTLNLLTRAGLRFALFVVIELTQYLIFARVPRI